MKRGKGNRERERERERGTEREREREREGGREGGEKYIHGHTYMDNLTSMLLVRLWRRMKELVHVQQTSQQLLRRPGQCISLRITVESTATILVDIHTNPKLKCASLYTYPSHRIQSRARLVDSPPSCLSPALSPSFLPPPPNFYKYIIHVHAHIHAHTHSSTCTQTLPVYYTCTLAFQI